MTTEETREPTTPSAPRGRRRTVALVAVAISAVVLGLGIYSGVRARNTADSTLRQVTPGQEAAVATVNVVNPQPGAPFPGRSACRAPPRPSPTRRSLRGPAAT